MPRFLREGWFEMFLPVHLGVEPRALRVWVAMQDLVPLLRQLDHIYGSEAEPYCRDVTQVRAAQDTLARLVVELVAAHPAALQRVCAPTDVAERLTVDYGVRRADVPLPLPPWLDQVDLVPADVAPLLARLHAPEAAALNDLHSH